MQTENLKSFFVWYAITCHLTTYRASRNRFSAISFHDYLHYCGIFLAHFSMKIDRNIISSLHFVFSLCARVGWCDVCTDFTNVIKVDVDLIIKVDVDVNRGPFFLRMFSKFQFDARNRWYAPASVFRSRIAKGKKQENTPENNNGSSI